MKDLGIQPRVIDLARDLTKRIPGKPPGMRAKTLVDLFDLHGSHDDSVASACDDLYLDLRACDVDADGSISPAEAGPYADLADDLYQEIQTNDREGDGLVSRKLVVSDEPAQSKPGSVLAPVKPALGDLNRRAFVLTLWSSRGARYAFEKSRPLIEAARPDAVMLHTDPIALAHGGAELNAYIRKLYPWLRVLWAIYGDSYGPDPSRIWAQCARAAEHDGVESLMVDAEASWKRAFRGSRGERVAIARRCVVSMRTAAPTLHLSLTTYDDLVNIRRPDGQGTWGGHSDFPSEGFEGDGSPTNAEASQVYVGHTLEDPSTMATALNRYERYLLSRAAAVRRGLIGAHVEPWMYVQIHGSKPAAICALAEKRRVACGWASNTRVDALGMIGVRAACELARRNQTVREFQASAGLPVNGDMGPRSLEALLPLVLGDEGPTDAESALSRAALIRAGVRVGP